MRAWRGLGIVVFSLVAAPAAWSATSPSLGNTLLPYVGSESFNPALAPIRGSFAHGPAVTLPLGTVGMLRGTHNPLGLQRDPDTFLERFDALAFYEQLIHPGRFLITLPQSPEAVRLIVGADQIAVTDEDGEGLDLRSVAGGRGIAVPRSPLVPAPIVSLPYRAGPLHMRSGVFIGETGHSLQPNAAFEELLAGEPQTRGKEYRVTASAGLAAGLSQSATLAGEIPVPSADLRLIPAVRAVGFLLLAYADAESATSLVLPGDNQVPTTSASAELFYLYPGTGFGGGGRVDVGLLLEGEGFTGGIGMLNLLGAVAAQGHERSLNRGFALQESAWSHFGADPSFVVHGAYRIALGRWSLYLLADSGYGRTAKAHGGVVVAGPRVHVALGGGWRGSPEAGAGIALRLGPVWIETSLTYHQAAFTEEPIIGAALSVAGAAR
jgi:hypothetical protein